MHGARENFYAQSMILAWLLIYLNFQMTLASRRPRTGPYITLVKENCGIFAALAGEPA